VQYSISIVDVTAAYPFSTKKMYKSKLL